MVSKPKLILLLMIIGWGTANANVAQTNHQFELEVFEFAIFVDGTIVAEDNMLTGNTNDTEVSISTMKVFNDQNELVLHITECGNPVCSGSIASLPDGDYTATAYTSNGRSFTGEFTK